jgi:Metallo-peptidase family M12/IPT/TIG domain/FG-GAP-like repeat
MKIFGRNAVRIVFLAAALGATGRARAERAVDDRPFRALDAPLAVGATVVLEPVALDDGTDVVLEVSRVEVFTKGAEIVVHGPDGDSLAPLPSDHWFTGRVSGDPESLVMLARGRGLRGFILTGTRSAVIGPEGDPYAERPGRTVVRTFSPETDVPEGMRTFTCGAESLLTPHRAHDVPLSSQRRPLTTVMYYAGIAIETDYELYVKKGSSATALTQYVGDLFAAVSAVYQRDLLVTLQVNYLSIWATASDPWAAANSDTALYEFGDYWHANRSAVPRTTAHFLSGKGTGGGVAWLGTICWSDFLCANGNCGSTAANGHYGGGYGFSGNLSGTAPANITTTYWDFLCVSHEIGHNFGSPHTHCYSPPVDMCYSGEPGCYSGPTSVPLVKGTIMSYCHLLSGGYSNIKMFFGVAGEPSAAVTTLMRGTYIEHASCLGTVAGPTVSGISPPGGSTAGGTAVTITGTGFTAPATVKIRGVAATSVVVVNGTTITAVTPAGTAGTADVWVIVTGSQGATLAGGFTYSAAVPPPTVSAILPNNGSTLGGTAVSITGASFVNGATVSIGGVAATGVSFVNAMTLTATTGAHATGTVNVVVTNPDAQIGTLVNGYFYAPIPSRSTTNGDYDGDGKTDIAVYRPSTGTWWILRSSDGAVEGRQWGLSTDIPVAGDYDGDGKTDVAVYRPSTGTWWILRSSDGTFVAQQWGLPTDIPVPGDYDGDGKVDIAVYRPSTGTWWILRSSDGTFVAQQWGLPTDVPVAGDYDGDGKTDIAVYRPSTGTWWILRSSDGTFVAQQWGLPTDVPVAGDYDGDGKTDIAVYRPSTGTWWILRSSDGTFVAQQWGLPTDVPVAGDYDRDGKLDIAVYRPSTGTWRILRSSDRTFTAASWGLPTDKPAVGWPR